MSMRLVALALALISLAMLAPPGAAQTAPADEAATDAATSVDTRSRVRTHLLHGAYGGVVRAKTRWVEDHWEYKQDEDWVPLPPGTIGRARLESEALDELKLRRREVDRDDLAGQVDLARWMIDEGLYTEGFDGLDEILRDSPDHPAALELLRSGSLPIRLPPVHVPESQAGAALDALLDFAAASPPALREMAVARMEQVADQSGLRDRLDEMMLDDSPSTRAMAALALRRLTPTPNEWSEPELTELLRRAVRDRGEDVRVQASLALGSVGEEGLIVPVVKALESSSSAIRTHAAESLGLMGYDAAVEPLVQRLLTSSASAAVDSSGFQAPRGHVFVGRQIAFVQDFDVDIAQNAAIGDPSIGTLQEGVSLDVRVLGVSQVSYGYTREMAAVKGALSQLTGVTDNRTKTAWKSWWDRNRAEWTAVRQPAGRYADSDG